MLTGPGCSLCSFTLGHRKKKLQLKCLETENPESNFQDELSQQLEPGGAHWTHGKILFRVILISCAHVAAHHGMLVEVRGVRVAGVHSCLSPCGSRGLNPVRQAWWQAIFLTEPAHQPTEAVLECYRCLFLYVSNPNVHSDLKSLTPWLGILNYKTF